MGQFISVCFARDSKMANMAIKTPSKLFWQVPFGKMINNNYVCLDRVLGELTCSTCYYQCYGRKRMERHIVEKHSCQEESHATEVQEYWPKVIVENIGASPKKRHTSNDDFNEAVRKYASDLGFYVANRSDDDQPEHMEHPDIIINDMEPNVDPDVIDQSSKDQEHAEVKSEPTGDSIMNIPNEDNRSFKLSDTSSLSLDFAADDVTFSSSNSETSGDCHANSDNSQEWQTIRSSETSSLITNGNFTDFTIGTILEEKTSQTPDSPMEPNTDQPESSTKDNWTTVRSSKRSSLIAKISPDDVGMESSEESGLQSSTPEKVDNNLSFHCKDLVLGELICDYCSYTNFSKRAMINHLKKKHQWTEPTFVKVAEEDIIEAPIIEIPSAISPIHEKHVTFAEEDTIITDFSLDTTPTSSTFKTVTKKKPFIYDGSDILNKLFSMEP